MFTPRPPGDVVVESPIVMRTQDGRNVPHARALDLFGNVRRRAVLPPGADPSSSITA